MKTMFSSLLCLFLCSSVFAVKYYGDSSDKMLLIKNNIPNIVIEKVSVQLVSANNSHSITECKHDKDDKSIFECDFNQPIIAADIVITYFDNSVPVPFNGEFSDSGEPSRVGVHRCLVTYTHYSGSPRGSVCNENRNLKLVGQVVELDGKFYQIMGLWPTITAEDYPGLKSAISLLEHGDEAGKIFLNPANSYALTSESFYIGVDLTKSSKAGFKIRSASYLPYDTESSSRYIKCKSGTQKIQDMLLVCGDQKNTFRGGNLKINFFDNNILYPRKKLTCDAKFFNQSESAIVSGICRNLPNYSLYTWSRIRKEDSKSDRPYRVLRLGYTKNFTDIDQALEETTSSSGSSSFSNLHNSSSIYITSGTTSKMIESAQMGFMFPNGEIHPASCKKIDQEGNFECGTNSNWPIVAGFANIRYKGKSRSQPNDCYFNYTMIKTVPVSSICYNLGVDYRNVESVLMYKTSSEIITRSGGSFFSLKLFSLRNTNKENYPVNLDQIKDYISKNYELGHTKEREDFFSTLLNHEKTYQPKKFSFSITSANDKLNISSVSYLEYIKGSVSSNRIKMKQIGCTGIDMGFRCVSSDTVSGGIVSVIFNDESNMVTCKFDHITIDYPTDAVFQLGRVCWSNPKYSVYPDETNPNILRLGYTRDVYSKFMPNLSNIGSSSSSGDHVFNSDREHEDSYLDDGLLYPEYFDN